MSLVPSNPLPLLNHPPAHCHAITNAVALTMMGYSLPLRASSKESVEMLDEALLLYVLAAVVVTLFFFQMHDILELTSVLLWHEQGLLLLWLITLALLPVALQQVIAGSQTQGSVTHWTNGLGANVFLLSTYVVLSGLALLLSGSLCRDARHRADATNQSARQRERRGALVVCLAFVLLVVVELFSARFNAEFMYLAPMVLLLARLHEAVFYYCTTTTTIPTPQPSEDDDNAGPVPARLAQNESYPQSFLALVRGPFSSLPTTTNRAETFEDLFMSVTGTALTILGGSLPAVAEVGGWLVGRGFTHMRFTGAFI